MQFAPSKRESLHCSAKIVVAFCDPGFAANKKLRIKSTKNGSTKYVKAILELKMKIKHLMGSAKTTAM